MRRTASGLRLNLALLVDLQGPKIRLGQFENGGCILERGSEFTISTEPVMGTCERASTVYGRFAQDVQAGVVVRIVRSRQGARGK